MPNSTDMPDLLLELDSLARDAGVDFESISPAEAESTGQYQRIPLNAVFGGNFFEISDFLYRLRNLVAVRDGKLTTGGRLFDVSSIELKENPGTFPRLEASLTINAYVRGSSASAAPASSAGTSSTSGATASASGSTPASGGQR
jgi:Tfp pilus assembly protein PilO